MKTGSQTGGRSEKGKKMTDGKNREQTRTHSGAEHPMAVRDEENWRQTWELAAHTSRPRWTRKRVRTRSRTGKRNSRRRRQSSAARKAKGEYSVARSRRKRKTLSDEQDHSRPRQKKKRCNTRKSIRRRETRNSTFWKGEDKHHKEVKQCQDQD